MIYKSLPQDLPALFIRSLGFIKNKNPPVLLAMSYSSISQKIVGFNHFVASRPLKSPLERRGDWDWDVERYLG